MRDALKSLLHCNKQPWIQHQTWVTARCDVGTFLMHTERKAA